MSIHPRFTRAEALARFENSILAHTGGQWTAIGWGILILAKGGTKADILNRLKTARMADGKPLSWARKAAGMAYKFKIGALTADEQSTLLTLDLERAHAETVRLMKSHMTMMGANTINEYYRVCDKPTKTEGTDAILADMRQPKKPDGEVGSAPKVETATPSDAVPVSIVQTALALVGDMHDVEFVEFQSAFGTMVATRTTMRIAA